MFPCSCSYLLKSDRFHLSISKKLGRVLITLDRDFNEYEKTSLKGFPGVIIISVGSTTPLNITKVCQKIVKLISQDFVKNSLIKVTVDKLIKIKEGKMVYEKNI